MNCKRNLKETLEVCEADGGAGKGQIYHFVDHDGPKVSPSLQGEKRGLLVASAKVGRSRPGTEYTKIESSLMKALSQKKRAQPKPKRNVVIHNSGASLPLHGQQDPQLLSHSNKEDPLLSFSFSLSSLLSSLSLKPGKKQVV